MPALLSAKASHHRTTGLYHRQSPAGHVPEPGSAEHGVLQHAPGRHGQLVGDAASCAHLSSLPSQLTSESLADSEVAGYTDQTAGDRLVGFVDFHWLVIGETAAAFVAMEHETTIIGRPGQVERGSHGPTPVQHADGRSENRQPVHEVGGAVQRVQHPEDVLGWLLGLFLFLSALFP